MCDVSLHLRVVGSANEVEDQDREPKRTNEPVCKVTAMKENVAMRYTLYFCTAQHRQTDVDNVKKQIDEHFDERNAFRRKTDRDSKTNSRFHRQEFSVRVRHCNNSHTLALSHNVDVKDIDFKATHFVFIN